jgi:hypothetical protein
MSLERASISAIEAEFGADGFCLYLDLRRLSLARSMALIEFEASDPLPNFSVL